MPSVITRPAALALLLALTAPACGWIESEGNERLDARYQAGEVILSEPAANFFGLESKGSGQVRGNGALALTADHLWFSLLTPKTEITIPLQDVLEVSLVKGHLGKTMASPLVHVRFRTADGEDAAAWLVHDPERWRQEIAARAGAAPR
ncbi:MAG TPA: hypothetical protein PKW35_23805 [Nannocystaceae bacterium]|nr:hypothetical protein [Nannocystaceae bacterium]